MKHLLIILMLSLSTVAQAQSSSRLKTQISGDNQTLSIQLDGNKQGKEIHFRRTFDVSHMNGVQIDLLKYRTFASQGVTLPIHEMQRLMGAIAGGIVVIALAIAFVIVRYQTIKGSRPNSEKRLQVA